MIPKASPAFRPRLVLDTNVCLDLFLFRDPRWRLLMEALILREVEAVTREDCRREFELVLAYEKMKLPAEAQIAILAEFDQWVALHATTNDNPASIAMPALPVCKDGDDQKFLELALACKADVLITKDKALLKLARKTARNGQFRILAPQACLEWYAELKAVRSATA